MNNIRLEFAQTQLTVVEKENLKTKTGEKRLSDAIRVAVESYLRA